MPANAGSLDTAATYRQHRSHLTPDARSISIWIRPCPD
jgi:hypothetical protein